MTTTEVFNNFSSSKKETALKKAKELQERWSDKYLFLKKKLSEESLLSALTYIDFHPNVRTIDLRHKFP